jgi:hypothetical protein
MKTVQNRFLIKIDWNVRREKHKKISLIFFVRFKLMKNISVKTKKASQVTCLFVLIDQEQPNDCCDKITHQAVFLNKCVIKIPSNNNKF